MEEVQQENKQQNADLFHADWFKDAFETAVIGMALVSPEGKWLQVNDALPKIVGYTKEELYEKTFQNITHPDDLDADLAYVEEMLQKKRRTYVMEKRYIHKEGHIVWVRLSVSLVWKDAKPLFFVSQIQDITEEHNLREKLQAQVADLEVVNKTMMQREMKMIELKKRISELESRITN